MQFYCPVCQKTYELAPETTLTTKLNQQAHKAHCPTCQQDMATYGSPQGNEPTLSTSTIVPETDPQTAVDQALKEFGSTVN